MERSRLSAARRLSHVIGCLLAPSPSVSILKAVRRNNVGDVFEWLMGQARCPSSTYERVGLGGAVTEAVGVSPSSTTKYVCDVVTDYDLRYSLG